jgi:hypothetical protein
LVRITQNTSLALSDIKGNKQKFTSASSDSTRQLFREFLRHRFRIFGSDLARDITVVSEIRSCQPLGYISASFDAT